VTLHVLSLRVDGWPLAVNGHDLKGDWKIHFSARLPFPGGGLTDLDVSFKTGGGSGDSVYVSFQTVGATVDEMKPYYCSAMAGAQQVSCTSRSSTRMGKS